MVHACTMDVGEMIRLYVELGDPDMPIPRLCRVLEQLGITNAAVAVAAMAARGAGGWAPRGGDVDGPCSSCLGDVLRRLAPFVLLLSGAKLIFLSAWVSRGPARRRRLARAVARASVPPLLLSLLLGAYAAVDGSN